MVAGCIRVGAGDDGLMACPAELEDGAAIALPEAATTKVRPVFKGNSERELPAVGATGGPGGCRRQIGVGTAEDLTKGGGAASAIEVDREHTGDGTKYQAERMDVGRGSSAGDLVEGGGMRHPVIQWMPGGGIYGSLAVIARDEPPIGIDRLK